MAKFVDISGRRFGRLEVVNRGEDYISPSNNKLAQWNCLCDCGNYTLVLGSNLKRGKTKSCGCYNTESLSNRVKHGLSEHPIYSVWYNMINRCHNPNNPHYFRYGGKGVEVCEEWRFDITSFYNYCIENGWNENLTIDRINTHGSYTPDNCRFITIKQNVWNTQQQGGASRYKGVSYCNRENKWISQITENGNRHFLGRFDTEEDAAKAYNEAVKAYFGEFGYLNKLEN